MAGMLVSLAISNFILIESANVEFGRGLTVITGETGAGKSMIIQSLSFGMGERADASVIRRDCDEAKVVLKLASPTWPASVREACTQANIPLIETLICDRRFTRNGKSRVTINGVVASVTVLKHLMSELVDVVSQFDQQRLLHAESHLDVVDTYAQCDAEQLAYAQAFTVWQQAKSALQLREAQLTQTRAQEEFLRYQLEELQKAKLVSGEEEKLLADRDRVRNRAQWEARLQQLDALVDGDTGLNAALTQLTRLTHDMPQMSPLVEQMQVAAAELSQLVNVEASSLSGAPADLDAIESRLFTLQQLARKYKTDAEGLIVRQEELTEQLKVLDLGEEGLDDLRNDCAHAAKILATSGKALTTVRRKAVKPLTSGIQKVLAEVGMQNATLHMQWRELAIDDATPRGMDAVEFLISPNVGEPLLPMAQIASGGELSRILLAIECVLQSPTGTGSLHSPTLLVFDEVDTGVSGRVATAVGSVLQRLAQRSQVICITHLPQVACFGDAHLQVVKAEEKGRTQTRIEAVSAKERKEAIARLLAGDQLTDTALKHAADLLAQAARGRNTDNP
ncbi:MAG: DNA repair protein RecN [Deltaproteobacteria bacterium CG11_big_fil_rev_8_21_14_0_20_47_16]|nr:MAG: DNA repair protein RecN [Deltaproteobacteria bacterium CG11_big_fil_rev_8_21_14_0_20_47_16]